MRGGIWTLAFVLTGFVAAAGAGNLDPAIRSLPPGGCVGDCDVNGAVTVEELISGVNIALGTSPLSQCPPFDSSGDGAVTVDEISAAVTAALRGCPLPLPTASSTATNTPTPTSTPSVTRTPTLSPTLGIGITPGPVVVTIQSAVPVGLVAIVNVTLTTSNNDVGGFQNDIIFDNTKVRLNQASDCRINPEIGLEPPGGSCMDDPTIGPCKNLGRSIKTCGGTPPADGCPEGAGNNISVLRALLAATEVPNTNTVPSGVAYSCTFSVVESPFNGAILDNANVVVGNPRGRPLPSTGLDGAIVTSPPPNTSTAQARRWRR